MANTDLTRKDVEEIVSNEIGKFVTKELEDEVRKMLKRGKPREEIISLMKTALTALYKYMWIRKDVWQNDIK